jgi:hypothetical protein
VNLQDIAVGVITAINPQIYCLLQMSTGSNILPDGTRIPTYAEFPNVACQIQPLTTGDLKHLDGLNLQGIHKAVYVDGNWDAVVRTFNRGGTLITTPDSQQWLLIQQIEAWNGTWTKFAMTLQNTK